MEQWQVEAVAVGEEGMLAEQLTMIRRDDDDRIATQARTVEIVQLFVLIIAAPCGSTWPVRHLLGETPEDGGV